MPIGPMVGVSSHGSYGVLMNPRAVTVASSSLTVLVAGAMPTHVVGPPAGIGSVRLFQSELMPVVRESMGAIRTQLQAETRAEMEQLRQLITSIRPTTHSW